MISTAQLESFAQDGCVVIENFLDPAEVATLRRRIATLLSEFNPAEHPLTLFPTANDSQLSADQYFFDSSTKASYFLEHDTVVNGQLVVEPAKAVNKIGHGLHIVDPVFQQITHSRRTQEIAQQLGFRDPRALQSMVICKQPAIGGAVPMHQDSTFLFTDPPSACGFWIALEDCTLTNGCLHFVPGSHRSTPVTRRWIRKPAPEVGTEMVDIEPTFSLYPFKGSKESELIEPKERAVEVAAGSLVLIHGQVLHRSSHNYSSESRWIYTFHIVEGSHSYDDRNWLQMPGKAPLTKL
ncbi:hypothetical protein IWW55_000249 [Coemansia sp. RSA 2706]|nr:hypothetical protein IWW55_000249 [Coemansia sp. RSA 2706]KAJ2322333.1 hypothetical protein IWW52_000166 [Coemansia sp. RSA 2704]KAJ2329918.1 hypothetical protein IWW51_000288 [Coemansia sp. RSA 2702]KAJ2393670.1 hypothetical protein H4S02_000032 [Coemansia sp. RSA 2611]KAJ2739889.1 hypothetical protein H4R23_000129 [Coemansia sp. Cherry 401B]